MTLSAFFYKAVVWLIRLFVILLLFAAGIAGMLISGMIAKTYQ